MNSFRVDIVDGVLLVVGDLDAAAAPLFPEAVDKTSGDIRVDLRACTFMDSSGLNALIAASKVAEEREAAFTLVAPSRPVAQLLRVCGMESVFATEHDEPPAG